MFGIKPRSVILDTACMSIASSNVGPLRAKPATKQGRFVRYERQGHELGESACYFLETTDMQQMPRPVDRPVDMAEHDCCRGAQTQPVRTADGIEPGASIEFVRTDSLRRT